jgi:hypothetical protein
MSPLPYPAVSDAGLLLARLVARTGRRIARAVSSRCACHPTIRVTTYAPASTPIPTAWRIG